jgi:Na+/H+-translocating membrane pyrophosphatase
MSDTPDKPEKGDKPGWTGKAALTGAAIGSAALAAALLYASRRKERLDKAAKKPAPGDAPETD